MIRGAKNQSWSVAESSSKGTASGQKDSVIVARGAITKVGQVRVHATGKPLRRDWRHGTREAKDKDGSCGGYMESEKRELGGGKEGKRLKNREGEWSQERERGQKEVGAGKLALLR